MMIIMTWATSNQCRGQEGLRQNQEHVVKYFEKLFLLFSFNLISNSPPLPFFPIIRNDAISYIKTVL